MALLDKTTRHLLLGVGLGAGGVIVAPYALPIVSAVLRPLTKAIIKQAFWAFEVGRERLALGLEGLEDVIAEVRAEVDEELARRRPPGEPAAPVAPERANLASRRTTGDGSEGAARP